MNEFDHSVQAHVYSMIVETTRPPGAEEIAEALGFGASEVQDALQRLADQRILVLQPGTFNIRMAEPFAGVATPFRVRVGEKVYFANCIWDSLGVAAALDTDAEVSTACGDCGDPMKITVDNGAPIPTPCVIHYGVPAAHWWDDVIHT